MPTMAYLRRLLLRASKPLRNPTFHSHFHTQASCDCQKLIPFFIKSPRNPILNQTGVQKSDLLGFRNKKIMGIFGQKIAEIGEEVDESKKIWADSVKKKRRRKMNKHKYKKRIKKNRKKTKRR